MKNARLVLIFLILAVLPVSGRGKVTDTQVRQTMMTATRFMMDRVSYQGGFVWQYLPDLSRSWGELEARRSMVWIQPSGTPTVGVVLVDAYEATGDDYYLKAALKVAKTLIKGQLPCGGWNYVFDLDGEDSLKTWYETVGKNAWRLEEFQHYYGNATFDDGGTIESGTFLLRLNQHTKVVSAALEKVIRFVLESQYPNGGWPQRYPLMSGFSKNGVADYTGYITLNDDVLRKNIEFLMRCHLQLGRPELKEAAIRAMKCCRDLQQKGPYPGWADQYTLDGKPAQARSYEPRAINLGTTPVCISMMMDFFRLTGDTSFLSGIPAALKFLESQKLSDSLVALSGKKSRGTEFFMTPRFIDPDNGKPLYVHRKGSNVVNGQYYINQDISHTLIHYSSQAFLNLKPLWEEYEKLRKSPIPHPSLRSQLESTDERRTFYDRIPVERILESFNPKGYWPAPQTSTSNPYIGTGPTTGGEDHTYSETTTGDLYDTSPNSLRADQSCISTGTFTMNMQRLILYLKSKQGSTEQH